MDPLLETTRKIALVNDASQAVLSSVDLDEVLHQILAIIRDHFPLQSATVLLLDKAKQNLVVRAHLGHSQLDPGFRVPLDKGPTRAPCPLRHPIYPPDFTNHPPS